MCRACWLVVNDDAERADFLSRFFIEDLEERARETVRSRPRKRSRWSVGPSLDDEIALTLAQLDQLRERERETLEGLLRAEAKIETELMQRSWSAPKYSVGGRPAGFPRMQARLDDIGRERRRLKMSVAEKIDAIHAKLLGLVNKRRHFERK